MKRFCLNIFFLFLAVSASAQTEVVDIRPMVDVCVALSKAIGAGDETIRNANEEFKALNPQPFNTLELVEGERISLNGHFVFDCEFIDRLVKDDEVYDFAERYAAEDNEREVGDGEYLVTTYAVKKMSCVVFSFDAHGYQEIAVVAEPGGAVNMAVYDKTHDKWYKDTAGLVDGKGCRTLSFELPEDEASELLLEIDNVTSKDISFVVISN